MRGPPTSSGSSSVVLAWIGFALLVGAHFGVRPLLGGRASVDFLVIAILFAAVRIRPGLAAMLGFAAGLAIDALVPATFGAGILVMTCVAFGASWTKAAFFTDHIALTGLFVFVGKWVFDTGYVLIGGGARGLDLAVQLILWSPASAALTATVAVVLLTAFRPLYRPQAG